MDLHQLDERINDAGTDTSHLHDLVMELDQNDRRVEALRIAIENHGAKLSSIQGWSDAAKSPKYIIPPVGLRPGTEVADVSSDEGAYTGPIDAARLTDGNKAYIANHLGDFSAKWGQVFNGKVQFPAVMGDLANTPEDPVTPDGYDLSAPLPSQ